MYLALYNQFTILIYTPWQEVLEVGSLENRKHDYPSAPTDLTLTHSEQPTDETLMHHNVAIYRNYDKLWLRDKAEYWQWQRAELGVVRLFW